MFNWPKKQLVFVNLVEDQNVNGTTKVDGKTKSGKNRGSLGVPSPYGDECLRRLETSEEDDVENSKQCEYMIWNLIFYCVIFRQVESSRILSPHRFCFCAK